MLALIPAGDGERQAARLAAFTQPMRNLWAAEAHVTKPSADTWRDLCDAVRGRTDRRVA